MAYIRTDLPYQPLAFPGERAPWIGGDLQTIRNTMLRIHPALSEGAETLISLPDGDRLLCALHETKSAAPKGVILIAHGLAGDYDSSYVRYLSAGALSDGYHCLRLNLRGAGKGQAHAISSYHAGRADDLGTAAFAMADAYPALPLYLCAFSLAGTMAVNLVARHKVPASLRGVASFCAPLDMVASAKRFHEARNYLYNRHFTKSLITQTLDRLAKKPAAAPKGVSADQLARVKSVREFDDIFTSQIAGYQDADAYYRGTTPLADLGQITVPTMLVHSDNDPLIPADAYHKIKPHKALFCVMTRGGGHVGFHSREMGSACWQSQMALQFFNHQHIASRKGMS